MGVDIPQPFHSVLDGPVTVAGIPSSFSIGITTIPALHLNVDFLPVLHLAIDNIPKINLGVDPVELRMTQFPNIRGHLPADFNVGFSLFGMDIANIRLCGEAQIITEPYHPNPCEVCSPRPPATGGTDPAGNG
ncbi:MAG: hypothetical protein ACT4P7_17335 [Gemmatimonadaceae bacterium]